MTGVEKCLYSRMKPDKEVVAPWDLGYNAAIEVCILDVRKYLEAPSCDYCGSAIIDGRCVKCHRM